MTHPEHSPRQSTPPVEELRAELITQGLDLAHVETLLSVLRGQTKALIQRGKALAAVRDQLAGNSADPEQLAAGLRFLREVRALVFVQPSCHDCGAEGGLILRQASGSREVVCVSCGTFTEVHPSKALEEVTS